MDRLQTMRVFVAVVDEGSFAAAARALDLSPAAVTRMVADLEAHLGVRLLQRSTRSLALTDAGQAYLERVRHILTDLDEAATVAQRHNLAMSGVLRLFAPPVLAVHILAPSWRSSVCASRASCWRSMSAASPTCRARLSTSG